MILRIKRCFEICDTFSGFGDGQAAFLQIISERLVGHLIPFDVGGLIGRDNVVVLGVDY